MGWPSHRRLGFPPDLLDRAEGHLPKEEARMEELLAVLERKEKEAADLVDSLARERAQAERLKEGLQEREEDLRTKERTARARAQEEARQLLLEARREVEEAIKEVRAARERTRDDEAALEEAQRKARRRVEAGRPATSRQKAGNRRACREPGSFKPETGSALSGTGSKGTVVEVREDRAVVETAGVRLQFPLEDLVVLASGAG